MKLNAGNVDRLLPAGLSADARAILSNIKFGPDVVISKAFIRDIADKFKDEWGEERASAALIAVCEKIEAVGADLERGHPPGSHKMDETVLPATEGDRIFRRSLRKGQQVAIVSKRPLEDGRWRVLVTHEKIAAVKSGFVRARTTIDGRGARMDIGILLVYSTNKFPNELKRTFENSGELDDWFSGLEAKEEEQMMAADKTIDLKTWRSDARRGTRVEVHTMTSAGQKISRGKILEPAKKGARLQMDEGNVSFKHWNEIYPEGWLELQPEPPKPKTLGKLGDVIDLKKAVAAPPPTFPAVLKRASFKAPERCEGPARASVPIPVAKPAPEPLKLAPPRSVRPGRGGKLLPHVSTAIGNIFRSERLKRAWNQKQCAAFISRTASIISDIELGDTLPDDDTLLQFSERFGIGLDLLLSARDGHQEAAADPVLALNRIAALEGEVTRRGALNDELATQLSKERQDHIETKAGLRAAEELLDELREKLDKATMPWDAQALQAVNEFIAKLTAVSPVPTEPEKRHAWYEAALKMFGANK